MSLKSLDFANDVFKLAMKGGGKQCHRESVEKAGTDTQKLNRIMLAGLDRLPDWQGVERTECGRRALQGDERQSRTPSVES